MDDAVLTYPWFVLKREDEVLYSELLDEIDSLGDTAAVRLYHRPGAGSFDEGRDEIVSAEEAYKYLENRFSPWLPDRDKLKQMHKLVYDEVREDFDYESFPERFRDGFLETYHDVKRSVYAETGFGAGLEALFEDRGYLDGFDEIVDLSVRVASNSIDVLYRPEEEGVDCGR